MKTFLLAIVSLTLTPCSSDDDNSNGNKYSKTVNIKFDINTNRNSEAIINRTLDNYTETYKSIIHFVVTSFYYFILSFP